MKQLRDSEVLSRHHGAVIAANCRPGPGRGPAPAPGPDRWWWLRWRMFDGLMWDAIDAFCEREPGDYEALLARLPSGWPGPVSGLLSIRQMEWIRVSLIGRRPLDVAGRFFA